jgi:hypothetical protein
MEKMIGGLRQIESKEPHSCCSSPMMNNDYQTKRMRKVTHMTCMRDVVSMYKISSVYLKGRDHLEDVSQVERHNWKGNFL